MDHNSLSVAIVDDHTLFREVVSRFLTYQGFTVLTEAMHGQAFLTWLETCPRLPDICLLDIEMPVMDGYETARHLRRKYPSIRILALSLFLDKTKEKLMLRSGADCVLAKEGLPDKLKETLLNVYRGKRRG